MVIDVDFSRVVLIKKTIFLEDNMVYEILNFSVGEGSKELTHGNIKP